MCGILALLLETVADDLPGDLKPLLHLIDCRGPDYQSQLIDCSIHNGPHFKFKASVLHLRGETLQAQPVVDEFGNVLLFNGQVYKHSGRLIDSHQSDTSFLSQELSNCKSGQQIVETFADIDGPFAIIYWQHNSKKLFYGRDIFGRKSLCMLRDSASRPMLISSVIDISLEIDGRKWSEVDCYGIHCIDFNVTEQLNEILFPWNLSSVYPETDKCAKPPLAVIGGPPLGLSQLGSLNADPAESGEFDDTSRISALDQFELKLLGAVKSRYELNKRECLKCRREPRLSTITKQIICSDAKVAVAFSGGIDSTILALALDRILDINDTIDLITVAFKAGSPDREAVGSAFEELRRLSPSRRWRLVICDVSLKRLQEQREKVIRNLILPCDSVFDDGIGCACWFVGLGIGRAIDSHQDDRWISDNLQAFLDFNPANTGLDECVDIDYKSPASMLFAGTSIDEQLGGYSSHRRAWSDSRLPGLYKEISYLMRRISRRNLGRDDRIYGHHGRDLKLPFLDSEFVSFLNELPIGLKMNLDEPLDLGPKKILRELAMRWGLYETGRRVKRAMQFGTRIANLEGTREKADDICRRLRPPDKLDHTSEGETDYLQRDMPYDPPEPIVSTVKDEPVDLTKEPYFPKMSTILIDLVDSDDELVIECPNVNFDHDRIL